MVLPIHQNSTDTDTVTHTNIGISIGASLVMDSAFCHQALTLKPSL